MAFRRLNAVQQFATGVGVGALTLGGATSARVRTVAVAGLTEGETTQLRIDHATILAEWEVVDVQLIGGTLLRTFVDGDSFSATGALINFSVGDKIISSVVTSGSISNRRRLDGDEIFYADGDTGDDDNDGSEFQPYKTFVGALNAIHGGVDFNNFGGRLLVANGSYTLGIEINEPFVGYGARDPFAIVGNVADPTQVRLEITEATAVRLRQVDISLDGMTIAVAGSGSGIVAEKGHGVITLGNLRFEGVAGEMLSFGAGAQLAAMPGKTMTVAGNAQSWIHCTHGGLISLEDYTVVFEGDPEFSTYLIGLNGDGSQVTVNRADLIGGKSGQIVVHYGAALNHSPDSGHIFSTFFQPGQLANVIQTGGNIYSEPAQDVFYVHPDNGDDRNDGYDASRAFKTPAGALAALAKRTPDQINSRTPKIKMLPGAAPYNANIALVEVSWADYVNLEGDPITPANVSISTGGDAVKGTDLKTLYVISGFSITSTGGPLVQALGTTRLKIGNLILNGSAGSNAKILGSRGSWIESMGPITDNGGSQGAFVQNVNANISLTHAITTANTPNYTQAYVVGAATGYTRVTSAFSGTGATGKRFARSQNAIIEVPSASLTYLPGDVAGTGGLEGVANPDAVYASNALASVTGTTSETQLAAIALPILGGNSHLRISYCLAATNNANNKQFRVRLGSLSGTDMVGQIVTTGGNGVWACDIYNKGAANAQGGGREASGNSSLPADTVNTAVVTTLYITGQLAVGTDTLSLVGISVEHIKGYPTS